MSVLLEVQNLQVELPTQNGPLRAVRGIDFHVDRGEMLCLVGESGCGKSMTSLALMGLLPRRANRQATRLKEAPAQGKTIFEYAPESNAAEDYARVVDILVDGAEGAAKPMRKAVGE